MISLSHLNKLTLFAIFFAFLTFNFVLAEEEPADIWEEEENKNEQGFTPSAANTSANRNDSQMTSG